MLCVRHCSRYRECNKKKIIDKKPGSWRAYIQVGMISNEIYSMLEDKC